MANLAVDRDSFRDAYNEAMREVRGKEEEVRKLQGQVRGLKSWVSSSSKVDEQIADEAVGERMQRLGNGLQNWVITNFRRVRIGMFGNVFFFWFHSRRWLLWIKLDPCFAPEQVQSDGYLALRGLAELTRTLMAFERVRAATLFTQMKGSILCF